MSNIASIDPLIEIIQVLNSGHPISASQFVEFSKTISLEERRLSSVGDALARNRISQYPFKVGDKVLVTLRAATRGDVHPPIPAFVCAIGVLETGEVFPQLHKCKKDGSESSHRLYIYERDYFGIHSVQLFEEGKSNV